MRVNPDKLRKAQFLFPETTKNFYDLPLEFKVSLHIDVCSKIAVTLVSLRILCILHVRTCALVDRIYRS